jgi:hypothetical protein
MRTWERVANQAFGPFQGVCFAHIVGSHLPIRSLDIGWHNMGAYERLDELAHAPFADFPVKSCVHRFAYRDREFPMPAHIVLVHREVASFVPFR